MALPQNVPWITTTEAADVLGCTTGRVRQLMLDGTLATGRKLSTRMTVLDQREVVAYSRLKMATGRPRVNDQHRG